MSREELLQGLKKNWYLIAALVLVVALAAVKFLVGAGDAPGTASGPGAGERPTMPTAPENLDALQAATTPDQQEETRTQIEEYRKKIAEEPKAEDTPAYLMAMGNLYRQKLEDYDEAITCYERIILDFPESTERRPAFLQLEACYLALEDRTGLKWLYEKMVEEFPEDSQEYKYAAQQLEDL